MPGQPFAITGHARSREMIPAGSKWSRWYQFEITIRFDTAPIADVHISAMIGPSHRGPGMATRANESEFRFRKRGRATICKPYHFRRGVAFANADQSGWLGDRAHDHSARV